MHCIISCKVHYYDILKLLNKQTTRIVLDILIFIIYYVLMKPQNTGTSKIDISIVKSPFVVCA